MGISIMLVVIFLIWFMPFLLIASSNKTDGTEKLAWLLAMFFVSWFAWIFYMLLAPLKTAEARNI
jgi:hypothetical protein